MTRIGKQEERRHKYPKKHKKPSKKTGSLKDNLKLGYKEHANATDSKESFIPKIK
jgi:hypothetical protein